MYTQRLSKPSHESEERGRQPTVYSYSQSGNYDLESFRDPDQNVHVSLNSASYFKAIKDATEKSCPFCTNFSVLRYARSSDMPDLESPATPASWEVTALLMEAFGLTHAQPGLFSHIAEAHKEIVKVLQRKNLLATKHRRLIDTRDWAIKILKYNTPDQVRKVAIDQGEHPQTILTKSVQQLIQNEVDFPFLKQERKAYEAEIQADPMKRLGLDR